MIRQPNEMKFDGKKFSMIIYGAPGIGKTTLAMSAPNPLLIDFDGGVSRIKAYHRHATIEPQNYEEVKQDLESAEIREYETIVVDTGGAFISYLQDWAMRQNPQNKKKDGALSQQGYGVVKREFLSITSYIRDTLKKNVIYVFHSEETKDKAGEPQQRILCEGAAKNLVWQPCDFGGYLQMSGKNRVISFTPTDEFFAKGCYGIEGQIAVPTIGAADKNDFITKLFEMARENIAAESEAFKPIQEQYDKTIAAANEIIGKVADAETATAAAVELGKLTHALTSQKEVRAMMNDKVTSLGLKWDKKAAAYVAINEKPAPAPVDETAKA
ncbi:MAG: ATP-binding protein [Firmicutes bacterium]|nr:ATP-binding protein [Bacillota bacterium]